MHLKKTKSACIHSALNIECGKQNGVEAIQTTSFSGTYLNIHTLTTFRLLSQWLSITNLCGLEPGSGRSDQILRHMLLSVICYQMVDQCAYEI